MRFASATPFETRNLVGFGLGGESGVGEGVAVCVKADGLAAKAMRNTNVDKT
jgi:hypothetical protein